METLENTQLLTRDSASFIVEEVLRGIVKRDISRTMSSFHKNIEFRGFNITKPIIGKESLKKEFFSRTETVKNFDFKLKATAWDSKLAMAGIAIEYQYDNPVAKKRYRIYETGLVTFSEGLISHYISTKELLENWDL